MTDKELAETVLELLGYERGLGGAFGEDPPFTYWRKGTDTWYGDDHLEILDSHGIAAEVKEFMRKRGWCNYERQCRDHGRLGFWRIGENLSQQEGKALFRDQDSKPRAICEAAIAALKGET